MTLLNGVAMFAVITLMVPIFVHLRKCHKSMVVDWPAMQFLRPTVIQRRRGLILENLLLLFLRCLLVCLFVLAMARPTIQFGRFSSSIIFCLLAGSGLLLLTTAIVSRWPRGNRTIAVVIAVLLFGTAAATLSLTAESPMDTGLERDVVLVIDSSLTMTLGKDDTTHFDNAIAQARSVVGSLTGNSTVSIVLAGPIAETVPGSPFGNLRKADRVLETLAPVAGGSDFKSAMQQAESLLNRAPNRRKQVLLLTDNQLSTWESVDAAMIASDSPDTVSTTLESRSESGVPGRSSDEHTTEPELVSNAPIAYAAIVADLPQKPANISVSGLHIKSSLITVHRMLPIEIEVRNGGSTTIQDVTVKLLLDGRETASESLIQIEPGAKSTTRFLHAFTTPGQHVVSAAVEIADLLPEDNRIDSIVDVAPYLSVLVVNGCTDTDPAQQSATFAQLALDPTSLRQPPDDSDSGNVSDSKANRAIIATVISATGLHDLESLEDYQLVMLCDVPRLPVDAAERLARFVDDGGGLWVIPGEQADQSFYNHWRVSRTGETILPAQLGERNSWSANIASDGLASRLGVALDVAGRPFISDLFEQGDHDLAEVSFFQFRSLTPSERAVVGMRLTNGAVLFADHAVGQGRALVQSVSLARTDSSFPATVGFPVLMHLWTHHLAASRAVSSNVEPTSDLVTELDKWLDASDRIETLRLSGPDEIKREVPVAWEEDVPFARVGRVVAPGVYQLTDSRGNTPIAGLAVLRDPRESDLSTVSEDRLSEISRALGMECIDDVSQLTAPRASESAGLELWDSLLFIVLWLLAAECLLTKWIRNRRTGTTITTSVSPSLQIARSHRMSSVTTNRSSLHWNNLTVNNSAGSSVRAS